MKVGTFFFFFLSFQTPHFFHSTPSLSLFLFSFFLFEKMEPPPFSLYVNNLAIHTSKHDLRAAFEKFNPVCFLSLFSLFFFLFSFFFFLFSLSFFSFSFFLSLPLSPPSPHPHTTTRQKSNLTIDSMPARTKPSQLPREWWGLGVWRMLLLQRKLLGVCL